MNTIHTSFYYLFCINFLGLAQNRDPTSDLSKRNVNISADFSFAHQTSYCFYIYKFQTKIYVRLYSCMGVEGTSILVNSIVPRNVLRY